MAKAVASDATYDWGTPDPRDADAYPRPPVTPMTQWSWEFLRRRKDYRSLWGTEVGAFVDDHEGTLVDQDHRTKRQAFECYLVEYLQNPLPGEKPPSFQWRHPAQRMGERFKVIGGGLNPLADPRLPHPPIFQHQQVIEVLQQADGTAASGKGLVEVNWNEPIESQIANIRRLWQVKQRTRSASNRRPVKPQFQSFCSYLRLLDFLDEPASKAEIGRYLFPNVAPGEPLRSAIRTSTAAARKWQTNYLLIALHHPAAS